MAGIYLHIPFCRQACHYCNFHFSTSLQNKNEFVPALLKEAELRKEYIGGQTVDTVYFGGGTPSLLDAAELEDILRKLRELFPIRNDAELTLEANPDDITVEKLRAWKKAGINRLSIGIQSFFEEDLLWMHRAHNSSQAVESLLMARAEGFDNISADLIYGGPGLSDEKWKENVSRLIGLGIPHLSCYALTVEPKTALEKLIRLKKKAGTDPENQARQFLLLTEWMAAAGYEHYEISNFAVPGKRSRHNSSYWKGDPYLGLGPSAHSFDGDSRQWNISSNVRYIELIASMQSPADQGDGLFEKEILSPVQRLNEYIMTSLRTAEGCNLEYVSEKFGREARLEIQKNGEKYIRSGTLAIRDSRLVLTKKGLFLADGIAASLFFLPDGL